MGEGVNRVYIVTLPDLGGGKTDPDRLIKESGIEAFREVIRGALPYYEYKLQETLNKYGKIENEKGLQPKDIDSLLDEVVETAYQIPVTILAETDIKSSLPLWRLLKGWVFQRRAYLLQ